LHFERSTDREEGGDGVDFAEKMEQRRRGVWSEFVFGRRRVERKKETRNALENEKTDDSERVVGSGKVDSADGELKAVR